MSWLNKKNHRVRACKDFPTKPLLLAGLEKNAPLAWECLVHKCQKSTISYLRKLGADPVNAEIIFIESTSILFERLMDISKGEFKPDSICGYISRTSRNLYLKSKDTLSAKNTINSDFTSSNFDVEDTSVDEIEAYYKLLKMRDIVKKCLPDLPKSCQGLMKGKLFEGMSNQELAEEFGMKDSSVRTKLAQCKRKLMDMCLPYKEDLQ